MLDIRDLRFEAEGTEILNGIDLQVEPGRFLAITGPNGGGKTTLAKAIMGIYEPTGGSIFYNGADITHMSITERARQGISYGFQQPPRFKGLTVRDMLILAAGKKLTTAAACEYLNRVGLCAREYVDRELGAALSGGEIKRIEIATLLARNASLMIFDEPEAGIDLWSFHNLTETFEQLHEDKALTLLIITHQERILSMADEILLVSGGKITRRGGAKEILPEMTRAEDCPCGIQR